MTEPASTGRSPLDETFDQFLEELRNADPDLDGLEVDPASLEQVEAAERQLGVSFPPSYREFLLRWNGGSVYDTSLYGVESDEGFDLAILNLRGREEGLPVYLVCFAATLAGDVYCFDTSQADEVGECPVSLIDVDQGQVIPACGSFLEWLERIPTLEQEITERRGPQPMTIDEWESFVTREREKLRKLSQTPAKNLTMPDPEQVRADLEGKIPVDPRHLKPKS